ncbi:MAG TPA: radical SAM protein, partial [Candidatus Bathyarchaeia archaeon]
ATVAMTITTDSDDLVKLIEPQAPSSSERLEAARILINRGVSVLVRIDPIIPFVNDNPENLLADLACLGVRHVTASTYKVKPDNWKRFSNALPRIAEKVKPLYFENGGRANGYVLLPRTLRLTLLTKIRKMALSHGMEFAVCREDLSHLNTASCDGSWLLPQLEA